MMSEQVTIEEKVRFWEEQDRINQELIPRVIRQNELLSQHIADHDNLQQILSDTIQAALDEQAKQYAAALHNAHEQLSETHDLTTQAALKQLNETHDQVTQAALDEQAAQYAANLSAAKAELSEQTQATLAQALETLRQDARRTRNRLTSIALVSVAIALTALAIALP